MSSWRRGCGIVLVSFCCGGSGIVFVVLVRWCCLVLFIIRRWRKYISVFGWIYFGVGGLVVDIVNGCTIYAGIVDAGEHEHLLVLLMAHHAGTLLVILRLLQHLIQIINQFTHIIHNTTPPII